MRIIKKILIILVIIIAIPLIAVLFISKDFSAQSEITIDKPKQEVFNYVKMLKNQDHFGVWQLSDPQMKKSEQGIFILKEISPVQTSVTWGISGISPYPWNFMNLFMNMNKDFDQGLKNLKNILK